MLGYSSKLLKNIFYVRWPNIEHSIIHDHVYIISHINKNVRRFHLRGGVLNGTLHESKHSHVLQALSFNLYLVLGLKGPLQYISLTFIEHVSSAPISKLTSYFSP